LRQPRDRIPIRIVRRNEYQRVVCCASAQAGSARIQYTLYSTAIPPFAIGRISPLLLVVCVVTHKKMPTDRVVLGGEGMKGRNVIVIGQPVAIRLHRIAADELARIAASLNQHDALTRLGQASRDCAAARA